MAKRRYSDDERANALAALAANRGNVSRTARDLGVPLTTLTHWVKGQRHPEAAKMGEAKKGSMADAFEALAWKLLGVADAKAELLSGQAAVVAAAVAVDKMRLLRNEATAIDEHRGTVTSRIDHLAAAFEGAADRSGPGGVSGDGGGEPVDPGPDQGGPDAEAG